MINVYVTAKVCDNSETKVCGYVIQFTNLKISGLVLLLAYTTGVNSSFRFRTITLSTFIWQIYHQ